MKQLSIIILAFAACWLAGCTVEEIENDNPKPEGTKSGLTLSAQIKQGTAGTRAVGDPFTAGKEEKRIDRIAFFVHTDEDGFQVYPPVPDADAAGDRDAMRKKYPNNVYLSGTVDAGYQAEVSLLAGGGYNADIIAVANLPNGYDYRQILTWEGLQDSITVWNAAMPACLPGSEAALDTRNALAMYGYCTKELAKEESNPISFDMERLVARIDITNEAYVSGATPDNHGADALGQSGFLLTSVKLLRAKPAAYLVPKPETPDVETTSDWAPLVNPGTDILYGKPTVADATTNPTREPDKVTVANAADAQNATLQYAWHTLYTYPNDDAKHAPTALEIKGWFKGTEITRQIPFVDKDKKAFPILGNHRYLVRIAKAPGQTDLNYNITVSEWDAVDTVNVKPDQSEVPVITNIDGNGVYLEKEKRYDVYYKADGLLTFDATCNFSAGVRVKYYDREHDRWTTEGNWVKVEKTAETPVTKATASYKSSFKITFDKFDTGVSRHAMLLVHNGGSEVECDTIFIRHTITFPGTDLEPTAFGGIAGKDTVWAPVNLGATRLPTKPNNTVQNALNSEELQSQIEETGYFYQWGRRFGVQPSRYIPYIEGPISKDEFLSQHEMRNVMIAIASYADINWLTPTDNSLWGDGTTGTTTGTTKGPYDPCPGGWRVPNMDEEMIFFNKIIRDGVWDNTKRMFTVPTPKVSGSELVASETGYLLYDGYGLGTASYYVRYWTSNVSDDTHSPALYISSPYDGGSARIEVLTWGKAFALPIRCIQE